MKPATTLRELLNPPFSHDHCGVGEVYCGVNKADYKTSRLAQIRGWGFFQYFENGEQLQDEFKDFAVNALNEKWERDFGNPRTCSCCYNTTDYHLYYRGQEMDMKYCPFCGRLLPPEEAQNV